jgi:predicted AAA+ superfamily ATPase
MEVQFVKVLEEKIITSVQSQLPKLTRRDAALPPIKGKAAAVIGPRRAGKTSFLHQCRSDLLAAGRSAESLLYFNFEDERLGDLQVGQLHLITDAHARLYPAADGATRTLFLDEIQRVSGWEQFVRRLLDTPGTEVFLSGSSAKLLSREIATSMRGRAWEVPIRPFSFREYLRHHGRPIPVRPGALTTAQRTSLDHHFARYLETGGFPEAQELPSLARRQLLQGYVDVLLLRDVIERHNLTNVTALRWLVRRLLAAPAGAFSVTKLSADLKSQGLAVGREQLYAFLSHLEDAFLLQTVPVATDSEKRRQVNPRKCYPSDTGFIPVFDRSGKPNTGHLLETAVFHELQRRQSEVAYIRTEGGFEVDFLERSAGGTEHLIQVCASVDDPATLAREVRALEEARAEHPRARAWLLTLESRLPYPEVPRFVQVLPAWQWMLEAESNLQCTGPRRMR